MAQTERRIYAVDPARYGEEVIAVAFARTSRVPGSIQESLEALTDEKAAEFHEKWVVAYGHASVAEHAVVHLAMENVSRLAVEAVEHPRLASYTEKSTRFQVMSPEATYKPEAVVGSKWERDYDEAHRRLFAAYEKALPVVAERMKKRYSPREGESPKAYDSRVRTKYIDVCRYALPRSVLATLGMTANARVIEAACTQMLSSEFPEVRQVGEEIKQAALGQCPTLVKYARESEYLMETRVAMKDRVKEEMGQRGEEMGTRPQVELVEYDPEAEVKYIAGWLYEFGAGLSFRECLEKARGMGSEKRAELVSRALGRMGRFDKPGREAELGSMTFDVVLDWGADYDFKRNRMMTQLRQEMDGAYGFVLPAVLYQEGVGEEMGQAVQFAHDLAGAMKSEVGPEHEYLYTNATLRRVLLHMNLRELGEFWVTRSAPNTNPGYRFLALRMGELAEAVYPSLWGEMKKRVEAQAPAAEEVGNDFFGREGVE